MNASEPDSTQQATIVSRPRNRAAMARSIKERFGQAAYEAYRDRNELPTELRPPSDVRPDGCPFELNQAVKISRWFDSRRGVVLGFGDPANPLGMKVFVDWGSHKRWDPIDILKAA